VSRRTWIFFFVLLLVALVTAGLFSQLASSEPDGLEYLAEQSGFADAAEAHDLAESPLADYGSGPTRGLAGIVGVLVTLAAGYVVFLMARKPRGPGTTASD
jgi:hypothetical protein